MTSAPGWYPDSNHDSNELYWDGSAWTGESRRRQLVSQMDAAAPAPTEKALSSEPVVQAAQTEPPASPATAAEGQPGESVPGQGRPPLTSRPWLLPLVTGVAGLFLGLVLGGVGLGILGAVSDAAQERAKANERADVQEALEKILPHAVRKCDADSEFAVVSDHNHTLTIEQKGKDDYEGITGVELWCIIGALNAPSSVASHMEQTTSMDGRQTESWDNIEASWSYHPDRGMDSVFEVVD